MEKQRAKTPMSVKQVPNATLINLASDRREAQIRLSDAKEDLNGVEIEIKRVIIASDHLELLRVDWAQLDRTT